MNCPSGEGTDSKGGSAVAAVLVGEVAAICVGLTSSVVAVGVSVAGAFVA